MSTARETAKRHQAPDTQARIVNGKLLYQESKKQADNLYLVSEQHVEDFMLLRIGEAPTRFEFSIRTDAATQVTMNNGAVLFTDGQGRGLKLDVPWGIDARQPHQCNTGSLAIGSGRNCRQP